MYNPEDWMSIYYLISGLFILCLIFKVILKGDLKYLNLICVIYSLLILCLILFRPVGPNGFMDSQMYIDWFLNAKKQNIIYPGKDYGFDLITFFAAKFFNIRIYFIIISLLSACLIYLIFSKFNYDYRFLFISFYFLLSFSFVFNCIIIRQNIGFLFFILAILQRKCLNALLLVIISISMHKSMVLPALILMIVYLTKSINIRWFILIWIISIPVFIFYSHEIYNLIGSFNYYNSGRLKYFYEMDVHSGYYSVKGFHWKTMFFSALLIIYLLIFSNYKYSLFDRKVILLFILTNSAWIIFSGINFHNRIAYLSLFLIPIVLLLPFRKSVCNVESVQRICILSFMIYIFQIFLYL